MQTIEGQDKEVNQLYDILKSDGRHHSIIKLLDEEIAERSFSKWAMAFQNLDTARI